MSSILGMLSMYGNKHAWSLSDGSWRQVKAALSAAEADVRAADERMAEALLSTSLITIYGHITLDSTPLG